VPGKLPEALAAPFTSSHELELDAMAVKLVAPLALDAVTLVVSGKLPPVV